MKRPKRSSCADCHRIDSLKRWYGGYRASAPSGVHRSLPKSTAQMRCLLNMQGYHRAHPVANPVLYMNAKLVKVRITDKKGAIAFVHGYTHWVVGPSAEANTVRLQERIIPRGFPVGQRVGSQSEREKTAFIHFTGNPRLRQQPAVPLCVEGTPVLAQSAAKLLAPMAASKGIQAALASKRLKGLTPKAARQLFTSTVTATVDYAASVWCTPTKDRVVPTWVTRTLRTAQQVAAPSFLGLFRTVSLLIASLKQVSKAPTFG
jgi:hypothetical protein